jgi:Ca-activated chloride channel family protein
MSDPLDDLKRALDGATPEADGERRKATIARATELFDRARESAGQSPGTSRRLGAWAAFEYEVRHLLAALTSRPVVAAAAGLAALGLAVLFVFLGRSGAPKPAAVVADAAEATEQEAADAPAEPERTSLDLASDELDVAPADLAAELSDLASPVTAVPEERAAPLPPPLPPEPATASLQDSESYLRARAQEIRARLRRTMEEIERANRQPARVAESAVEARAAEAGAVTVAAESALVSSFAPSSRSVPDVAVPRTPNTETFANEPASPVRVAAEEPVSTFSIDVDTASYSVVRSSLTNGYLPSPDSVRIEELINYFPYTYPPPGERGAPFRPTVTVSETPWNPDTLLMQIGIQGRLPATEDRPPLNLVFLIDTSGSMDQPNKLPLLVQSFRLLLGQLRPEDEVGIVTYAGSVNRVLDATPAPERSTILNALDRLRAAGSTAGAAGIQLAYGTAAGMAAEGEVTRVILATDGDFNVGISDPEQLERFIARQRDSGVYLSVLGFGRDNLDDATMQALAQNGNGQAATIDTLSEARKVLVDQLVGTLFPIADDVKIQVEFNPATVAEYRLIGYETRALRREDFNNDRVDAGEIGAGHAVTAIYEVTPVGSPAVLHDALRYVGRSAEPPAAAGRPRNIRELAFLRLRYKEPGGDASNLIELPIARDAGSAGSDQRFAAAIAGFGQLLRGSVYTGGWSYTDAIALAEANTGDDPFGYRREAVTLMHLARSLAE